MSAVNQVNECQPEPLLDQMPVGFNVHTGTDVQAMLKAIGLQSIDQLFEDIPVTVRLQRPLELPSPLSEWALLRDVRAMAALNCTVLSHSNFMGSGAYEQYIPAVLEAIVSRGEFLTAYTPYQPEMSQGLLQALFEFQMLISRLLGAECVNCSVYDGATACAEACWMMCSATGKRRVVVSSALWSEYREVLSNYLLPRGVSLSFLSQDAVTGMSDSLALQALLAEKDVAGMLLQSPNALGVIEDVASLADICHQYQALLCVGVNPLLCGWLEPPGQLGADIVACEGQALGLPLNAGGPYVGIIACTKPMERYLPGRLVGRVHDLNGQLGYALVKEDREQHVARDKATSHICSNQALNAIRVAIYLACLGEQNFMHLAQINAANARLLQQKLTTLPGVKLLRSGTYFNEFAVELPLPAQSFYEKMCSRGILAGVPVAPTLTGHDRGLLVAVTETKTEADIEAYVTHARTCLANP